ncbi:TetR/AcrR family transcriptional regulator C-terminal domain-containing protein [Pseudomaricurvus sp. HS19]|uniref:TetR/AcrR family transcriptional regulator C-terminal domain-containing protein n=1 Tax=Pseudomaricurvus sp. HS19 TaxID=2692626 RepID=UPI001368D166|nr:TetR/AcrR family transcriptional regulator C-terminal domain-containing protein [Pseudomaricurvus sp. HS19]MYM63501.1 TetR family transcriptional regulator [Pseudomaricurvus sp. HS19]
MSFTDNTAAVVSDNTAPTKRGESRAQAVLEAALELFLELGFANTSLDKVIEKAGGSRRTIYQMFGSKEGLLQAVVKESCDSILGQLETDKLLDMPPRDALISLAEQFISRLITPRRIAFYRLVVAESTHAPELGRQFMAAGPERAQAILCNYFRAAMAAGQLQLDNPEISARQFFEFARGDLHFHAMFDNHYVDGATLRKHIEIAVDVFLRGAEVRS